MQIVRITDEYDRLKWSDFVQSHPNGNIFNTPEMYDVIKNTKNYMPIVLMAIDSTNILGLLTSIIQKEYKGYLGKFTARSIIFGGPLIINNDKSVLNAILKQYDLLIQKEAIYSQFRNLWSQNSEIKIFKDESYVYNDHLDIIHDLTLSEDEMLARMHQGRRKNIRKSLKQNVRFEEITTMEELSKAINIIKNTYSRVKLPFPDISLFINSYNFLYKNGYVKYFSAEHESEMIGTRFVLCYKDVVYDWFAGSIDNHKKKYPNDFLPWQIMVWGKHNGYKIFDFGGAGKPGIPYGVREHKLKFGGDLVHFGRYEKTHKPILMKIGQLGFKIKHWLQ